MMELLLVLLIPSVLLIGATLWLSQDQSDLKQKLFSFELSGRSSQIWNFGVILIATVSIIAFSRSASAKAELRGLVVFQCWHR